MRPRKGNLLSPERRNPGLKTFYGELVLVDQAFREALGSYLGSHTISVSESSLRAGILRLRNYASGKTTLAPLRTYQITAPVLGLNPEVKPYKVVGVYPGMLLAYFFDKSGITMIDAVERLKHDFAEVDESIARRLQQGKRHSVECSIRDVLIGRKGFTPVSVLRSYERGVIDILGVDGITSEQLRETFKGDVDSLESRLGELVKEAKRKNPKPYEYTGRYTSRGDYSEGDVIRHNMFGEGEVVGVKPIKGGAYNPDRKSFIITVRFDDDKVGTIKLMVRPES